METVTLSGKCVFQLKRIHLNILSNDKSFKSLNRSSSTYKNVIQDAEKWLLERGWVLKGSKINFEGSNDVARNTLFELCASVPG